MCTVTLVARQNGYLLGMNRDEKLTRAPGLPPGVHRVAHRSALFPQEPDGGTWIGVNDSGTSFALINWYSVPARNDVIPVSRGEVVKAVLAVDSAAAAREAIDALPVHRMKPFRLIGIFPAAAAIWEWRWDSNRLQGAEHPWRTGIWISSGFDEPGAQQSRGKTFRLALRHPVATKTGWLRQLHQSHGPECGPYSICMHRADAATVSYTEIRVSDRSVSMCYAPGPPCCVAPGPATRLELRQSDDGCGPIGRSPGQPHSHRLGVEIP